MPRDLDLADRLRKWLNPINVRVVEVAGWRERGSGFFQPRGSVDHHTAGARTGIAPSLGIVINGRPDLSGPLAHTLQARDDLHVFLVAAGRANHAGIGGWRGLAGNSAVYGNERENVGTTAEPWTARSHEISARIHCAFLEGTPARDSALACEHKEWAPGRKPDCHTILGITHRALIATLFKTGPGGLPLPEEDDVPRLPVTFTGSGALFAPQGGGRAVKLDDLTEVEALIQAQELAREGWGQNPGMSQPGKITHKELDPDLFNRLYPDVQQ